MEKSKTTVAAERRLTEQLAEIMLRALRPGFHGRGTVGFDAKDGQVVSTDITLTERHLSRKE